MQITQRGARREWRMVGTVGATNLLLLTHAVLQGVGAATYWRPCATDGSASDACMYLQYEAPTPWWAYLGWLWVVEIALVVTVLLINHRSGRQLWPAVTALVFDVLCNSAIDYAITPAFNGGYTSADSPPGHGLFGAVGIGIAGCVLPFVLLPRTPAYLHRRTEGRFVGLPCATAHW
jgi:hypothetical protein